MTWYQYTKADGVIQASNSSRVDDAVLAELGRAQIEGDIRLDIWKIDILQDPPVLILVGE